MIEHPARVGSIDPQARKVVAHGDVRHAEGLRHRLQLAMAIGDADRTDVIALDEQQFERHPAVMGQMCRSSS